MEILQPPGWPRPRGYANGIAAEGRMVFVAGQIGWDEEQRFEAGLAAQVRRTLANVLAVLAEAGADQSHVVRLAVYLVEGQSFEEGFAASASVWGMHPTAITGFTVAGLARPDALVEIEAVAVID
jgi:2-iminobutanoate/2-iminopropanoate deaminase